MENFVKNINTNYYLIVQKYYFATLHLSQNMSNMPTQHIIYIYKIQHNLAQTS